MTWRLTSPLTRIWTNEQPLSCSGTPEGVRCLCLFFSFFFSTFFFPLRFGFLFVFLRGVISADELLGSCTEAVVGHATLLCSEERLRPKREIKVYSIKDAQFSSKSLNELDDGGC